MDLNKVIITGRLTQDPELRFVGQGQTPLCEFSLAVNRSFTSNEEKKEEVSFINVQVWGKSAEFVNQYFHKGRQMIVEGRLKQDRWEDKETKTNRSKIFIVSDRCYFMGFDNKDGESDKPEGNTKQNPASSTPANSGQRSLQTPAAAQTADHPDNYDIEGEDIPF